MRTTLDIDEDVLQAAKELGEMRGQTAGKVLSDLARKALTSATTPVPKVRNGVPLLPRRLGGRIVTMKLVNELRDERVSRVALLDVSLLIALFDRDHVHHEAAHDWFADHHSEGWATCPLSQNGFVRSFRIPGILPSQGGQPTCSITCGNSAHTNVMSGGPTRSR